MPNDKYLMATLSEGITPCFYGLIPSSFPARTTVLIKYDEVDTLSFIIYSDFTKKTITLSLEDAVLLDLKLDPPYHTFINDRILLRGMESPHNPEKRSLFYQSLYKMIITSMLLLSVTSCAGREVFFAQHEAIGTYIQPTVDTSAVDTITVILK